MLAKRRGRGRGFNRVRCLKMGLGHDYFVEAVAAVSERCDVEETHLIAKSFFWSNRGGDARRAGVRTSLLFGDGSEFNLCS